jgi:polyphosphate kinase
VSEQSTREAATEQMEISSAPPSDLETAEDNEGSVAVVDFTPEPRSLDSPSLYINRELGLLAFQRRVLEEAQDIRNPLLERFKFLAILGSNLDEFFMVRVAGLMRQVESGNFIAGLDGMSPAVQLGSIKQEINEIYTSAHRVLSEELLPALADADIRIFSWHELSQEQQIVLQTHFLKNIFPVLTPLGFDPGHPFPHISNLSLNLAVLIRDHSGKERFARIKVPDTLSQLVRVDMPGAAPMKRALPGQPQRFIWLDDLITANLDALFPGMEILESHPFHVTRDAEVEIQEWEAEDLLEETEEGIKQRRFGDVMRVLINTAMPERIVEILVSNLEIDHDFVYRVDGRLPLALLMQVAGIERADLKYPPFLPLMPDELNPDVSDQDIFSIIRQHDVLLHHPYDSFQPVVNFLTQAARDPQVLAIKMTLYRVGQNSPVVEALLEAMENGKQVAVLVELKARFDERSNIEWARALEARGVHVVYGLLGLKIHSKVALVVRREGDSIRRYVHMGTGNYNAVTAHFYTDLGLLTCNEEIGSDVTDLFNYLTGYSAKKDYRKLCVAPINLRERIEGLIQREIEHQRNGAHGHLIFKLNALVDDRIIRLLYEASRAGVQIDLLVRGICCLRPGIPGVSENIRVTSVIGRFLEHSRIFYFKNGGDEQIFMGSADLMQRNLNRRVETVFPVENERLARYLRDEVLSTYLYDNVKARVMQPNGTYIRKNAGHEDALCVNSQLSFIGRKQDRM